jgi:hypothetical protein
MTAALAMPVPPPIIGGHLVGFGDVVREVADFYQVPADALTSPGRATQLLANARHVAMYLCRNLPARPSFADIGRHFGRREHTTVMAGIAKIAEEVRQGSTLAAHVDHLVDRLGLGEPPAVMSIELAWEMDVFYEDDPFVEEVAPPKPSPRTRPMVTVDNVAELRRRAFDAAYARARK